MNAKKHYLNHNSTKKNCNNAIHSAQYIIKLFITESVKLYTNYYQFTAKESNDVLCLHIIINLYNCILYDLDKDCRNKKICVEKTYLEFLNRIGKVDYKNIILTSEQCKMFYNCVNLAEYQFIYFDLTFEFRTIIIDYLTYENIFYDMKTHIYNILKIVCFLFKKSRNKNNEVYIRISYISLKCGHFLDFYYCPLLQKPVHFNFAAIFDKIHYFIHSNFKENIISADYKTNEAFLISNTNNLKNIIIDMCKEFKNGE